MDLQCLEIGSAQEALVKRRHVATGNAKFLIIIKGHFDKK
jgi:hypothetical protein